MTCQPLLWRREPRPESPVHRAAIKHLQHEMQDLDLYAGRVNGVYTQALKEAVTDFQRRHGLLVDGITGEQVWGKLDELHKSGEPAAAITAPQLAEMAGRPAAEVEPFAEPLQATMAHYGIDTPLRQQHFLAQTLHESMGLRRFEESFHYSPGRVSEVFPYGRNGYDPSDLEAKARKGEEALANALYGGDWGEGHLGNTEPGDGWRFRGRGAIQLTGRANYEDYHAALLKRGRGRQILQKPGLLAELPLAIDAAGWYWQSRGLNDLADRDDVEAVTKRINGGRTGLADRRQLLASAKSVFPSGATAA